MMVRGAQNRPAEYRGPDLELVRNRLMIAVFLFVGAFLLLAGRMVGLGLSAEERTAFRELSEIPVYRATRADIVDRNEVVLATNLETFSLYADPAKVLDPAEAAEKIAALYPELGRDSLRARLKADRRFVWIKRKLTPKQMAEINALGIPGFFFRREEERVYPHGALFAHALGFTNVDGKGLAGVERYFDQLLVNRAGSGQALRLTLDVRIQHALRDEMTRAMSTFEAKGAAGIVLDVETGEVLALASLPDFDPNRVQETAPEQKFNRAVQGVYELGSIFKAVTFATALETGAVSLNDSFDATKPLKVSKFTIRDDHPQNRVLTVPEIFIHSSNIGAAQMALEIGGEAQREYFRELGLMQTPFFELAEIGRPIFPLRWREVNTMTAAYGHGIAVSPLQMASAIAATVNGGIHIPATMLAEGEGLRIAGQRVFSEEVSAKMRALMRLTVTSGTGKQANVPGYLVGGKTGTAEKAGEGAYQKHALISSFAGVFPMDEPRYLVLIVLDEPVGTAATFNFAGGGWVAAPASAHVIARIAPLLGVTPRVREVSGYRDVAYLVSSRE